MDIEEVKQAYREFLRLEKQLDNFRRECADEDEALEAEVERKILQVQTKIALIKYTSLRGKYIKSIVGEDYDDYF
jgi:hypothetical protein